MVEETREVEDRREGHVEKRVCDEIASEVRSPAVESRDNGNSVGDESDVDDWRDKKVQR